MKGATESGSLMPSAGKGWVEEERSECQSQVETEQGPLLAPGMTQCPKPTGGQNQCSADRALVAQHRCVVNRGQGWEECPVKGCGCPRAGKLSPITTCSLYPLSSLIHGLATGRFYLSENSHRKLRSFFFFLYWQQRKWSFFLFPKEEFLPITQRPQTAMEPEEEQDERRMDPWLRCGHQGRSVASV